MAGWEGACGLAKEGGLDLQGGEDRLSHPSALGNPHFHFRSLVSSRPTTRSVKSPLPGAQPRILRR